jgi:predicted RNA-binding Zn-ribbon protein involved in translation (DUF1610 family)
MGEVVELSDYKPHLSGDAICLACGCEWVQVAAVGTTELKCPDCELFKGVFRHLVTPDRVWECLECGNRLWYLNKNGFMCGRCGNQGDFEDLIDD